MKFVYINVMDEIEKLFQQSDFSSESIGLGTRIWNHLINYYKEANMPIDKTKLTKEMLEKAMKCQTADELIALAKTEGMEITKAEAEAYLQRHIWTNFRILNLTQKPLIRLPGEE